LVREAFLGVERGEGKTRDGSECSRRTGIDAFAAIAAAVLDGLIVFQFHVKEEFSQEEHTTSMGDDELMVSSYPS
jgi:hypothetical protein